MTDASALSGPPAAGAPSMAAAGKIAAATCAGYAAFETALALGAPLGRLAWGGAHRSLPGGLRIASAAAAAFYLALAALAARASRGRVPPWAVRVLIGCAALFAVGVPLNLASRSPAERGHAIGAGVLAVCFAALARRATSSSAKLGRGHGPAPRSRPCRPPVAGR